MKKRRGILRKFTREVFIPALKISLAQEQARETNQAVIGRVIQNKDRKASDKNQIKPTQ